MYDAFTVNRAAAGVTVSAWRSDMELLSLQELYLLMTIASVSR